MRGHATVIGMRYPGFVKTLGTGLAEALLDRWFPPAPSFSERFARELLAVAPLVIDMLDGWAKDPPNETASAEKKQWWHGHTTGGDWYGAVDRACSARPAPAAPFVPLGEFTCPKCGGHTWSVFGPIVPGAQIERICTNGNLTQYPGHNPNTVKERCGFRWFSRDDCLHFAPPTTKPASRAEHAAEADKAWSRPFLGTSPDGVERSYQDLLSAVGSRFTDKDESLASAASRIIREADAYIGALSDNIKKLILDNEFSEGDGEIGLAISVEEAAKIGLNIAEPMRVALVLSEWRWYVRVGGALVPIDWNVADELLREARRHG